MDQVDCSVPQEIVFNAKNEEREPWNYVREKGHVQGYCFVLLHSTLSLPEVKILITEHKRNNIYKR